MRDTSKEICEKADDGGGSIEAVDTKNLLENREKIGKICG